MPAEWHPHAACWMAWPSSKETYADAPEGPDIAFEKAKIAYSMVANAIAAFEPVKMLSNNADVGDVKRLCGSSIQVIAVEIDDGWLRDSGPTFVINKKNELAGMDWVFNENHPDHDVLQENLEILRNSSDAKDRPIEVVEMVAPYRGLDNGMILDACYINFYIANGGVIVPSYNFKEEDRLAYAIFKKQFPEHKIIQLDTEVIHYGGGNIHCITQQQPKAGK